MGQENFSLKFKAAGCKRQQASDRRRGMCRTPSSRNSRVAPSVRLGWSRSGRLGQVPGSTPGQHCDQGRQKPGRQGTGEEAKVHTPRCPALQPSLAPCQPHHLGALQAVSPPHVLTAAQLHSETCARSLKPSWRSKSFAHALHSKKSFLVHRHFVFFAYMVFSANSILVSSS